MSKKRSLDTHFWDDSYVGTLDSDIKFFFAYLILSGKSNMLGVYEIQLRRISFDTGLSQERVMKGFETLRKGKRADYVDGYVVLANFVKNQNYNFNMFKSAVRELEELPSTVLKSAIMGTVIKHLGKLSEGFGNPLITLPNIEIEDEVESEYEIEDEEDSSVLFSIEEEEVEVVQPLSLTPSQEQGLLLSEYMVECIVKRDPDHKFAKNPPDLMSRSWMVEFERAIRIDGRTFDGLKNMITYTFTKNTDRAMNWATYMKSGASVRKNYDMAKEQYEQEKRKKGNANGRKKVASPTVVEQHVNSYFDN